MASKKWLFGIPVVLAVVYIAGPNPSTPDYSSQMPVVPSAPEVETYVRNKEASFKLKPDNEARIIWNN
ncbi:alpha/beta hydrolase, partial [Flavihumibacter sediminis]|nr:alpha/beta hydrolase [Flavihumibacter sediminis]